jgi:hypothetical protein
MDLGIDPYLIKNRKLLEGAVSLAGENRLEVDDLVGVVVKVHPQGIGRRDLERYNSVDSMHHHVPIKLRQTYE